MNIFCFYVFLLTYNIYKTSELYADKSDELIINLSYKTPSTASYMIERTRSRFHAIGGNLYAASNGIKLVKFQVTSEHILDPRSLRFQFDIVNTDAVAKTLYPVGGPRFFFSAEPHY